MEPTSSRRGLLRAVGTVAAVGALAGCSALDTGTDTDDESETPDGSAATPAALALVPDGAIAVARVDVAGLLADERVRSTVNDLLGAASTTRATTLAELLDRLERRTGLDPGKLSEVVGFGDFEGDPAGAVVDTDWSTETLRAAVTDGDAATRTYRDTTVYALGSAEAAPLGDGRYAVGTRAAVEGVLDRQAGDAPSLGGDVVTAYSTAEAGYLRFGVDVPTEELPEQSDDLAVRTAREVRYGYGSVHTTSEGLGYSITVEADDRDAAERLAGKFELGLDRLREQVLAGRRYERLPDRFRRVVRNATVSREGTSVVVGDETGGGAVVVTGLAAVIATFVLGLGERQRPAAPTAAFDFEYDAEAGELTVTHVAGDTVPVRELHLLGDGLGPVGSWRELGGEASGTVDGRAAVVAGDSVTVTATPEYEARVVWIDAAGDRSATLASDHGPQA